MTTTPIVGCHPPTMHQGGLPVILRAGCQLWRRDNNLRHWLKTDEGSPCLLVQALTNFTAMSTHNATGWYSNNLTPEELQGIRDIMKPYNPGEYTSLEDHGVEPPKHAHEVSVVVVDNQLWYVKADDVAVPWWALTTDADQSADEMAREYVPLKEAIFEGPRRRLGHKNHHLFFPYRIPQNLMREYKNIRLQGFRLQSCLNQRQSVNCLVPCAHVRRHGGNVRFGGLGYEFPIKQQRMVEICHTTNSAPAFVDWPERWDPAKRGG